MAECCAVKEVPTRNLTVMSCPACSQRSKQVESLTVKNLVRRLPFTMPPAQYYFCEIPGCDVVYFPSEPDAPTFKRADLLIRVGVKESEDPIPICYCFGVTRQEIWEEIHRTGKSTAADRIKSEVKAGNCACEVKNPSGKCCLGTVTRVVQEGMKNLWGADSHSRGAATTAPNQLTARASKALEG